MLSSYHTCTLHSLYYHRTGNLGPTLPYKIYPEQTRPPHPEESRRVCNISTFSSPSVATDTHPAPCGLRIHENHDVTQAGGDMSNPSQAVGSILTYNRLDARSALYPRIRSLCDIVQRYTKSNETWGSDQFVLVSIESVVPRAASASTGAATTGMHNKNNATCVANRSSS